MEKKFSNKSERPNRSDRSERSDKPKTQSKRRAFSAKTGKMVYIGNLRYTVKEKDLFKMFVKFGKVGEVNLLTKPGSDESKGIAFIEMYKAADADKAIEELNGAEINGRTLKVSEAIDNRLAEQGQKTYAIKAAVKQRKVEIEEVIIEKKKFKRKTGLDELFANIGKK